MNLAVSRKHNLDDLTSVQPTIEPVSPPADMWSCVQIASWQFYSSIRLGSDEAPNHAKAAAAEGFTTLRSICMAYMRTPEYARWAEWAQQMRCDPHHDAEEPPTLLNRAVRLAFDDCATELKGCEAVPEALREQAYGVLKEVASEGASAMLLLVAVCGIGQGILGGAH